MIDKPRSRESAPSDLGRHVGRRQISMGRFAQEMRITNSVFARRVEAFEAHRGAMGLDLLAVAAQSNFLCWFEATFPESLIDACSAIAAGRPTRLTLCQQISGERWRELHAVVVAVQRWLGNPLPIPVSIDPQDVCRLQALLAERTPARAALARLYLWTLVQHLRYNTSIGQLAGEGSIQSSRYQDYGVWYQDAQFGEYGVEGWQARYAQCERSLVHECGSLTADAALLLDKIAKGRMGRTRPPCAQRFVRYQEIRLASIGALSWRGNLPAPESPRAHFEALCQDATRALNNWLGCEQAQSALETRIHDALGSPSPEKRALVTGFTMQAPQEGGFFAWLAADARARGLLAEPALRQARAPTSLP